MLHNGTHCCSGQKWEHFVLGYTTGQGKHGTCRMSMDNMSISNSLKYMGADEGTRILLFCARRRLQQTRGHVLFQKAEGLKRLRCTAPSSGTR